MTSADRGRAIFSDARVLHQTAVERLRAGDHRDAAEKAWCSAKRATDALLLVRIGREPETTRDTGRWLRDLSRADPNVRRLGMEGRYRYAERTLHGECFYLGDCDAEDDARHILELSRYIDDAEQLAF